MAKAWNKGLRGYNKDYPRSKEWGDNISKAKMGHVVSDETRRKIGLAFKGKPSNRKNFKHTEETKQKLREINLGKIKSEETIKKMSLNGSRYWLGKHHTEETNRKNREAHLGAKSFLWQGGVSGETEYSPEWNNSLRNKVRRMNGLVCKICGIHQDKLIGFSHKLDVHHIDYNKKNCSLENLISLCRNCHLKTNLERRYWTNYFTSE